MSWNSLFRKLKKKKKKWNIKNLCISSYCFVAYYPSNVSIIFKFLHNVIMVIIIIIFSTHLSSTHRNTYSGGCDFQKQKCHQKKKIIFTLLEETFIYHIARKMYVRKSLFRIKWNKKFGGNMFLFSLKKFLKGMIYG